MDQSPSSCTTAHTAEAMCVHEPRVLVRAFVDKRVHHNVYKGTEEWWFTATLMRPWYAARTIPAHTTLLIAQDRVILVRAEEVSSGHIHKGTSGVCGDASTNEVHARLHTAYLGLLRLLLLPLARSPCSGWHGLRRPTPSKHTCHTVRSHTHCKGLLSSSEVLVGGEGRFGSSVLPSQGSWDHVRRCALSHRHPCAVCPCAHLNHGETWRAANASPSWCAGYCAGRRGGCPTP